jgi:hypothetical protein
MTVVPNSALEPTGGWMFSVMTKEQGGTLTTAEKQAQTRNNPKPENGALNFSHNESRLRLKIL